MRAGPSRPGRCWSTTQRSYLMITVPPLEALYSLPLLEVGKSPITYILLFIFFVKGWRASCDVCAPTKTSRCSCHCGLCCLVILIKTKTNLRPASVLSAAAWLARMRRRDSGGRWNEDTWMKDFTYSYGLYKTQIAVFALPPRANRMSCSVHNLEFGARPECNEWFTTLHML